MLAAEWALAVLSAIAAAVTLRAGVRQWRNAGRPFSDWLRNSLFDAETRAGLDRGIFMLSLLYASFAGLFTFGALGGPHLGRRFASLGVLISVAVLLVSLGLLMTIVQFNRPRMLVPPHLRGEPGAIAGRRRRRREHAPMM